MLGDTVMNIGIARMILLSDECLCLGLHNRDYDEQEKGRSRYEERERNR